MSRVPRRSRAARDATLTPPHGAAAKLAAQHKLYVRDRIALLFDQAASWRTASWRTPWPRGCRRTEW